MLKIIVTALLISHIMCGEVPEEMKEAAATLHQICLDNSGVDDNLILEARKGNFPDPPTEALKCYMKCVYEELALFNDDGTIDVESMTAMVPDSIKHYADVLKQCGTQMGTDLCDTAYKTSMCYYEKDPKTFFII